MLASIYLNGDAAKVRDDYCPSNDTYIHIHSFSFFLVRCFYKYTSNSFYKWRPKIHNNVQFVDLEAKEKECPKTIKKKDWGERNILPCM